MYLREIKQNFPAMVRKKVRVFCIATLFSICEIKGFTIKQGKLIRGPRIRKESITICFAIKHNCRNTKHQRIKKLLKVI